MSARNRKVSLAELMGKQGAGAQGRLELSQLGLILGDNLPELPRNPIGRHRLVRALQQRFGPNFRSLPGVQGLIREFDDETRFDIKLSQMRQIKPRR